MTQTIPPFGKLRDLLAMSSADLAERHKSAKSEASRAVVLGAEEVPADVIIRATALYLSIQDALGLPWLSIDADELDEEDE